MGNAENFALNFLLHTLPLHPLPYSMPCLYFLLRTPCPASTSSSVLHALPLLPPPYCILPTLSLLIPTYYFSLVPSPCLPLCSSVLALLIIGQFCKLSPPPDISAEILYDKTPNNIDTIFRAHIIKKQETV